MGGGGKNRSTPVLMFDHQRPGDLHQRRMLRKQMNRVVMGEAGEAGLSAIHGNSKHCSEVT